MTGSDEFNPYHRWLGIAGDERPPNHYRLLALELFEDDVAVIRDACERQASHVRKYQAGEYSEISQKLLSEIAAARLCLTKPDRKAVYDAELRSALGLDASNDGELETDEADIEDEEAWEDGTDSHQVAAPDNEPEDEIEPDDLQGKDESEYVNSLPTIEGKSLLARFAGWAPMALLGLLVLVLIGLDWFWLTGRTWNPQPPVNERGFQSKLFVAENGTEHRYVVFVPHERSTVEKPPLLMFLGGNGPGVGDGRDGVKHMRHNVGLPVWELQRKLGCIVVYPQCPDPTLWTTRGPNPAVAIAIMDQVSEDYGADPDRHYLTGVSAGAVGALDFISVVPDRFAAVLPMSPPYVSYGGAASQADLAKILAEKRVPIWTICSEGDHHAYEFTEELHHEILKLGMSPRRTVHNFGGHGTWFWSYRNPMVWDWLFKQSLADRSEGTQGGFQLTLHENSLDGWTTSGGEWSFDKDGHLFGKAEGEGASGALMLDRELADFDLHFDAAFAETKQFSVLVNGLRLVVSLPSGGNGGLQDPKSGDWIAFNDAIAERELFPKSSKLDGWNEARVRVQGDRLTLELNGWPTLDVTDGRLAGAGKVGLQVGPGQKVNWQFVRIRDLGGKK